MGKKKSKNKGTIASLLEVHFRPAVLQDLVVMQRVFPIRMRADVQRVLEDPPRRNRDAAPGA